MADRDCRQSARPALATRVVPADTKPVSASYEELAHDKRLMAQTAAAMFGGATIDAAIEGIVPGDPSFAIAPALAALVLVSLLLLFGPRLPRPALAMLGPVGVAADRGSPRSHTGGRRWGDPLRLARAVDDVLLRAEGRRGDRLLRGGRPRGDAARAARGEQLSGALAGRDGVRFGPRRRHRDARSAQPRPARACSRARPEPTRSQACSTGAASTSAQRSS